MMRKFVLVSFLDGRPEDGGAFVHKRNQLRALELLDKDSVQVVVICSTREGLALVQKLGLVGVLRRHGKLQRISGLIFSNNRIRRYFGPWLAKMPFGLDALLRKLHADLVLVAGDDRRGLQLLTHNFVVRVWDLCHLEQPEFPEVAHRGEFERREVLNWSMLRKATALIIDSDYGKKLLAHTYGVDENRIFVAPFVVDLEFGAAAADEELGRAVRSRLKVAEPYIFYPAQFWAHKNHGYILRALRVMVDRGVQVPQVVFCGSDKGMWSEILSLVNELELGEFVNYCGFVPSESLVHLYRGALALVMPTYFGPTNIPPLEARALGVPVCYSDLPSFREQMGSEAHYMDLQDPKSLADLLEQLMKQPPRARVSRPVETEVGLHRNVKVMREIIERYSKKIRPDIWRVTE